MVYLKGREQKRFRMTMNYITEYVNAIHSGKCVVSRRVRMVYERLEAEALDPAGAFINAKTTRDAVITGGRFCIISSPADPAAGPGRR